MLVREAALLVADRFHRAKDALMPAVPSPSIVVPACNEAESRAAQPGVAGTVRGPRLAAPLLVALVAVVCAWPLAWRGYPLNTDDVHYHAIYAEQFLREMLDGALYPRWLRGMNSGLGAPTFFFYGPVPYWLTSLAGLLTGVRDGFALLGLTAAAVLIASGLSAYAWLRSLVACWPAAIGAALYVAMPYHLTVDLWTRSAFAEFTAYLWTSLLFLAIERIRVGRASGVLLLAPAFALLAATHIITAMLVGGMAGAYMVLRFKDLGAYARAAGGFALGAALAAAYLGPALGLRGEVFIPVGELQPYLFLLGPHLPLGREGLFGALTALLVAELVLAPVLLVGAAVTLRGAERRLALVWCVLILLALLGTTALFAPVWRALPVLQNAQFPFRLNTVADLGFATVCALLAASFLARVRRPGRCVAAALAMLAAAGAAQVAMPVAHGNFDVAGARWPAIFAVRSDSLMFRPLPSLHKLPVDRVPPVAAAVPRVQVVTGQATATLVSEAPRRFVLAVDAAGPATLRLGQLYFVGWRASLDGRLLSVRPSAEMGLLDVDVPPGRYELTMELTHGVLERMGLAVSGVAALAWLGVAALAWRRHKARFPPGPEEGGALAG